MSAALKRGAEARSARARADELRQAVGAVKDAGQRARLHVQLAELLRAGDAPGAREALRLATGDAPGLPAVTMAALALARTMPARERIELLDELGAASEAPVPAWAAAVAEAHAELGATARAAEAWLTLGRDERVPLYRRRVAARRAEERAGDVAPETRRAALRLSAALASGPSRLGYLWRALALAVPTANADELVAISAEWLEAGGPARDVDAVLARASRGGAAPRPVERVGSGRVSRARTPTNGRARPRADGAVEGRAPGAPLAALPDRFEAALAEAKAGHASRARRLTEAALRASPSGDGVASRVAAIETALREGGTLKDALRVRRTYVEGLADDARGAALVELADEAEQAGLGALARAWRADAGVVPDSTPAGAAAAPAPPETPAEHYLAAQRLLARTGPEDSVEPVLAALERAVAGHVGAPAALALAESLLARGARGESPGELGRRRLELLRTAHAAEFEASRRLRLAETLAETLAAQGDAVGAVAVLEQALRAAGAGEGERLRAERARLLRKIGRGRDLAAALEGDAGALVGDARLRALAERASLLDASGESEASLEVRLMALAEFPADAALLGAARRRLESTGRAADSLRLAEAAVERVAEAPERARLLRDIARLREQSGANPADAAAAWLAVLEIEPADAGACAAAERLLMAVGDWERCAELLSWAAARAGRGPARAAFLWRLAELRRARLDQRDEALRLYGELLSEGGRVLGPLHDSPDVAALSRRDGALGLLAARAAVAPTAVERARALLERSSVLFDRGRAADAERDVMRAIDLDPLNIECIAALERLHEGGARWVELAHELRQRAAALAAAPAARLWYGAGRASERTGDRVAAREAYRRAISLDPALPEPIAALGALAARDGDWNEVASLLESELALVRPSPRKGRLLAELAAVYGDHLGNALRAVELLEAAAPLLPEEPRLLDLVSRFNLLAGRWEAGAHALDRLAATGAVPADAAERYYRAGAAAEAEGQVDRALVLYSRSYARDTSFRPTLERLSVICFEKDQWDNAWKATEALLDRHGAALAPADRAVFLLRSALADVHVAQRAQATARLSTIVTRGGAFSPDVGIRDVAESWAAMRAEPRLLAGIESGRRDRIVARSTEALGLALAASPPAAGEVRRAREVLGALALTEERWDEALELLTALGDDPGVPPADAAGYLMAAGDVRTHKLDDHAGGQALYDRAAGLAPRDSRLGPRRAGTIIEAIAHDITDEMIV